MSLHPHLLAAVPADTAAAARAAFRRGMHVLDEPNERVAHQGAIGL